MGNVELTRFVSGWSSPVGAGKIVFVDRLLAAGCALREFSSPGGVDGMP